MKKSFKIIISIFMLIIATFGVGCNKEAKPVLITIQEQYLTANATLYDYMLTLKSNNIFDFEVSNGAYGVFITKLNGVENGLGSNPCWLIYTTCATWQDNSSWGTTIEHNGKSYRSTTVGASNITVSLNEEYLFYYTRF